MIVFCLFFENGLGNHMFAWNMNHCTMKQLLVIREVAHEETFVWPEGSQIQFVHSYLLLMGFTLIDFWDSDSQDFGFLHLKLFWTFTFIDFWPPCSQTFLAPSSVDSSWAPRLNLQRFQLHILLFSTPKYFGALRSHVSSFSGLHVDRVLGFIYNFLVSQIL